MKFNYQVRTKDGQMQTGVVEASSKEAATGLLQKYGFYVTYLEEVEPVFYGKRIKIFERVSRKDVVLFSRQLSMMFKSKIPLIEALKVLSEQTANASFKEKILSLSDEVEGGSSLSKAISKYPKVFSSFYVSIVKAGEVSGKLSEALEYLANHLEREYHFLSKIRGALIYPLLVLVMVIFIMAIMIFYIIPSLKTIFEGAELPQVTKIVLAATDFLKRWSLLLFSIFLILVFSALRYHRTQRGKKIIDKILLRIPMVSPLLKMVYLARFAENLATLISGGLYISQALQVTGDIMGNSVYKEAIFSARDEVRKGESISSVLSRFPSAFPPIFVQMILVGEKTGSLDVGLTNIADFYQKESERAIESLLSILEPLMIIILGVIVGGMILAILLPIYSTMSL